MGKDAREQGERLRSESKKWSFNKYWNDLNVSPPSFRLEKISIYVSVILSLVATALTIVTLDQSQRVEGIEEVLKSFKSDVRFTPINMIVSERTDKLRVNGQITNFGTRAAFNVSMEFFFLSNTHTYFRPDTVKAVVADLASSDKLIFDDEIENYKSIIDKDFSGCNLVAKVTFVDVVTSKPDSTYTFLTTHKVLKDSIIIFRPSSKKEIIIIQEKLAQVRSNF